MDHKTRLNSAWVSTRSLLAYHLAATLPLIAVVCAVLFAPEQGQVLIGLCVVGAIVTGAAFGALLYELAYDIAGYPEFKLPVWAVMYLVLYVISGFMFVFTALRQGGRAAFLDALYISLSNTIGVPPEIALKTRTLQFLSVAQGFIAMFVNIVVITKFVNSI
jgi:hypothetical protein